MADSWKDGIDLDILGYSDQPADIGDSEGSLQEAYNALGYSTEPSQDIPAEPVERNYAPVQRGVLMDIASMTGRGALAAGEMVENSLEAFGLNDSDKDTVSSLRKYNFFKQDIDEKLNQGWLSDTWAGSIPSAFESMGPSLTAAGAGALAGAGAGALAGGGLGAIPGGIIGAVVGSLGLMGSSSYQQTYEDEIARGQTHDQAHDTALKVGAIEGLGESAGTAIGLVPGIGWLGKGASTSLVKTLAGISKATPKQIAKTIGRTYLGEQTTEVGQSVGQGMVLREAGREDINLLEDSLKTIIPTMFMTGALSIASEGSNRLQTQRVKEMLNSDNKAIQNEAVKWVSAKLKGNKDKEVQALAPTWAKFAEDKINDGQKIGINEDFESFTAQKMEETKELTDKQILEDPEATAASNKAELEKPTEETPEILTDTSKEITKPVEPKAETKVAKPESKSEITKKPKATEKKGKLKIPKAEIPKLDKKQVTAQALTDGDVDTAFDEIMKGTDPQVQSAFGKVARDQALAAAPEGQHEKINETFDKVKELVQEGNRERTASSNPTKIAWTNDENGVTTGKSATGREYVIANTTGKASNAKGEGAYVAWYWDAEGNKVEVEGEHSTLKAAKDAADSTLVAENETWIKGKDAKGKPTITWGEWTATATSNKPNATWTFKKGGKTVRAGKINAKSPNSKNPTAGIRELRKKFPNMPLTRKQKEADGSQKTANEGQQKAIDTAGAKVERKVAKEKPPVKSIAVEKAEKDFKDKLQDLAAKGDREGYESHLKQFDSMAQTVDKAVLKKAEKTLKGVEKAEAILAKAEKEAKAKEEAKEKKSLKALATKLKTLATKADEQGFSDALKKNAKLIKILGNKKIDKLRGLLEAQVQEKVEAAKEEATSPLAAVEPKEATNTQKDSNVFRYEKAKYKKRKWSKEERKYIMDLRNKGEFFTIYKGFQTVSDALHYLIEFGTTTQSAVARTLIEYVNPTATFMLVDETNNKGVLAAINTSFKVGKVLGSQEANRDSVWINGYPKAEGLIALENLTHDYVVLHELAHSALTGVMFGAERMANLGGSIGADFRVQTAYDSIRKLYNYAVEQREKQITEGGNKTGVLDLKNHAFTNVHEFVDFALTDKSFQRWLESLPPVAGGPSTTANMLTQLWQKLWDILSPKMLNDTALSQVFRATGNILNAKDAFFKDNPDAVNTQGMNAETVDKLQEAIANKKSDTTSQLIAGEKRVKTSEKLIEAKRLAEDPNNEEIDIWKKTGWYKSDVDEKWRYAIDLSEVELKDDAMSRVDAALNGDYFEMGDILNAEEVFKVYPELQFVLVAKATDVTSGEAELITFNKIPDGWSFQDYINESPIRINPTSKVNLTQSLLHEMQHLVQSYEEFSIGTSEEMQGSFENYFTQQGEAEARDVGLRWFLQSVRGENIDRYMPFELALKELNEAYPNQDGTPWVAEDLGYWDEKLDKARRDQLEDEILAPSSEDIADGLFDDAINFMAAETATVSEGKSLAEQYPRYYDEKGNKISKDVAHPVLEAGKSLFREIGKAVAPVTQSMTEGLRNISEKLVVVVRKMELAIDDKNRGYARKSKGFLKKYNAMPKKDRIMLDTALRNTRDQDKRDVEDILKKNNMVAEYAQVKEILEEIHSRMDEVGMNRYNTIKDYFPRRVKDIDGLLQYLNKDDKYGILTNEIEKAQKKAEKEGKPFGKRDQEAIITRVLNTGRFAGISDILKKPGSTKERALPYVSMGMGRFYQNSMDTLMNHIYESNEAIETRKLTGTSDFNKLIKRQKAIVETATQLDLARVMPVKTKKQRSKRSKAIREAMDNAQQYVSKDFKVRQHKMDEILERLNEEVDDLSLRLEEREKLLDQSLASVIDDTVPNLAPDVQRRAVELIKARLGQKGMFGPLAHFRNVSLMSALGSPTSTITQLGDLAFSVYKNGAINTIQAIFGKKRLTKHDFNFVNALREFQQEGSAKWLDKTLTLTGLKAFDMFGKEVSMNASLNNIKKMTYEQFTEKWSKLFDDSAERLAVYNDIRNDNVTENVRLLAFYDLSDYQPVSLSEMPTTYLRGGNYRIFYTLKSFNIRAINAIWRESVGEIRKGNTKKGMYQFVKLTMLLAFAGASADELKDWIMGKDNAFSDNLHENLLKIAFMNKYSMESAGSKGYLRTFATDLLTPPTGFIDEPLKDIHNMFDSEEEVKLDTMKALPYGRLLFAHMTEGGAQARVDHARKRIYKEIRKSVRGDADFGAIRREINKYNRTAPQADKITAKKIKNVKQKERKKIREAN